MNKASFKDLRWYAGSLLRDLACLKESELEKYNKCGRGEA